MAYNKITIIRERKEPPDSRTPLTPGQAQQVLNKYPRLELCVESSPSRCFSDEEFEKKGISVAPDSCNGSLLLGIKEVPPEFLVPGKTYMFFSHTIKKQPGNAKMFKAILEKKITLIDYELLTDEKGKRVLAFGKWAGIVGAYNALIMYGKRSGLYQLPPAHELGEFEQVQNELKKAEFPPFRVFLAGSGNVGSGAEEILKLAGFKYLPVEEYLNLTHPEEPVYTKGGTPELYKKKNGEPFEKKEFYKSPESFVSNFKKFAASTDVFINAVFWDPKAPRHFETEDISAPWFSIQCIADITCDIDGSVPLTTKTTTIKKPVTGVSRNNAAFTEPYGPETIDLMAVPNLPAELPRDSSRYFGNVLMEKILPEIIQNEESRMIENATIVKDGQIVPRFSYLSDYGDGESTG